MSYGIADHRAYGILFIIIIPFSLGSGYSEH